VAKCYTKEYEYNLVLLNENFDNTYHDGVSRYASEFHKALNNVKQKHEIISTDYLSKYKNVYFRYIDTRIKVTKELEKIKNLRVLHLIKPESIFFVPKVVPNDAILIISWHDLIRINYFENKPFPQNNGKSSPSFYYHHFLKGYIRAYEMSSHIFAVSTLTAIEINEWARRSNVYDNTKSIVVANPGINYNFIKSQPYYGPRRDFIYLGTLLKAPKLLYTFHKVLSRLPNQKLYIFTQFKEANAFIVNEIKKNNWGNMLPNIIVHVNSSDDEIIDKLRQSVALLHIVDVEGFGSTILESLALGTPVIVPKQAKITPEVSKYTFKLDHEDIAVFCEQLYLSQAPVEQRAIAYAKSFSYENTAQSFKSIYEKYL
jgi:glycosyltransferase involved in cell wall biosynthesis